MATTKAKEGRQEKKPDMLVDLQRPLLPKINQVEGAETLREEELSNNQEDKLESLINEARASREISFLKRSNSFDPSNLHRQPLDTSAKIEAQNLKISKQTKKLAKIISKFDE